MSKKVKDIVKDIASTQAQSDGDDLLGYVSYEEAQARKEQRRETIPPTPVSIGALTSADLEQAWAKLSQALQPYIRKAVTLAADQLRVPEWQLVCGLIVHMWQSASLVTPVLDPSWQSSDFKIETEVSCEKCGKVFQPSRRGQRFCSNRCGMSAEAELWA